MNNLFSIIIPHINEGYLLDITLDSIALKETYNNYEIIIVDDGSDNYEDLDFLKTHPLKDKIRLYKQNGLGSARARNYGASVANGQILFFLDSHMYFLYPVLEKLNNLFNKISDLDLAHTTIGNFKLKNCTGKIYKFNDLLMNSFWDDFRYEKVNDLYYTPNVAGGAALFRKPVFDSLGGFNPNTIKWGSEDLEVSMRAWLMGYKCYCIQDIEIPHYFKQKFENTLIEGDNVIYNKLMLVDTCISNEKRKQAILKKFQSTYGDNCLKIYERVLNNKVYMDWSLEQKQKFIYNDDWYFDFFSNYFQDFQESSF